MRVRDVTREEVMMRNQGSGSDERGGRQDEEMDADAIHQAQRQRQRQGDEVDADEIRESDRQLHEHLVSLKNRRHALEAEELTYLLEAESSGLFRRRGYVTMVEYMERDLRFSAHAANERLRVAHALIELPKLSAELEAGELAFSSVRELTRVVTPESQDAWLAWSRGKTATEIQRKVSGLKRGDLPDTPKDPSLVTVRIVLEVRESAAAQWKAFRAELEGERDDERDERMDDTELLETTIRRAREPVASEGEPTRPAAQVALTTCKVCKRTALHAGGIEAELPPATAERLLCDSECVGDLEIDAPEHVTSAIPESTRRKVWIRDAGGCRVPGCHAARNLDVHHIRFRSQGGGHQMWNLTVLCSGHHHQLHEGRLTITGRAPDDLVFEWTCVDDEDGVEGPSGDQAGVAVEVVRREHAEHACEPPASELGDAIDDTTAQRTYAMFGPSGDLDAKAAFVTGGAVPA